MDKISIIRNFSRAAASYDAYADIQKNMAKELINKVEPDSIANILEIGCGTGNYTALLKEKFNTAALTAIDFSSRMLAIAEEKINKQTARFLLMDGEEVNLKEKFCLITSNACFQWFADLKKAMARYRGMLKNGGRVLFSVFGSQTFLELNSVLKNQLGNTALEADNFFSRQALEEILKANFSESMIEELRCQESFASLKELLEKIKFSGIRGNGLGSRVFFGRQFFQRLEYAYLEKFGAIKVTYQAFFCQGTK